MKTTLIFSHIWRLCFIVISCIIINYWYLEEMFTPWWVAWFSIGFLASLKIFFFPSLYTDVEKEMREANSERLSQLKDGGERINFKPIIIIGVFVAGPINTLLAVFNMLTDIISAGSNNEQDPPGFAS